MQYLFSKEKKRYDKSSEKNSYLNFFHCEAQNHSKFHFFSLTRFLHKIFFSRTTSPAVNLTATLGCHLYAGRIICRETDNWKTGFLACSMASEFRSHVPLFIHLFSLFGGSFITLHYLLSSVGEKIIDLEPDRLSVWDTLLGAGEFKHGGQFYQDR